MIENHSRVSKIITRDNHIKVKKTKSIIRMVIKRESRWFRYLKISLRPTIIFLLFRSILLGLFIKFWKKSKNINHMPRIFLLSWVLKFLKESDHWSLFVVMIKITTSLNLHSFMESRNPKAISINSKIPLSKSTSPLSRNTSKNTQQKLRSTSYRLHVPQLKL
jgi:hypothetical protein